MTVFLGPRLHRQRKQLVLRHAGIVGPAAPDEVHVVFPRRVDDEGAESANDRRQAKDSLLVFDAPQLAVRRVDLAGAIHLVDERAETFRLALCGLHDRPRFFQRLAGDPERRGNPVARLAPVVESFHDGLFVAALEGRYLPFSRELSLLRFNGRSDRHHFAGREVFAQRIFGKLAARDGVNVNNVNRHFGPAELLGGAQAALACDQLAVRAHDDWLQQADGLKTAASVSTSPRSRRWRLPILMAAIGIVLTAAAPSARANTPALCPAGVFV
jgi:hypothetical protein